MFYFEDGKCWRCGNDIPEGSDKDICDECLAIYFKSHHISRYVYTKEDREPKYSRMDVAIAGHFAYEEVSENAHKSEFFNVLLCNLQNGYHLSPNGKVTAKLNEPIDYVLDKQVANHHDQLNYNRKMTHIRNCETIIKLAMNSTDYDYEVFLEEHHSCWSLANFVYIIKINADINTDEDIDISELIGEELDAYIDGLACEYGDEIRDDFVSMTYFVGSNRNFEDD